MVLLNEMKFISNNHTKNLTIISNLLCLHNKLKMFIFDLLTDQEK